MGKKGKGSRKGHPQPPGLPAVPLPEPCPHYNHHSDYMDVIIEEILSSRSAQHCDLCAMTTEAIEGDKGRKEKGPKTVQKSMKGGNIWVCLACRRKYCGGTPTGTDSGSTDHARQHATQEKHWWVANYEDPTIIYCFVCKENVNYPTRKGSANKMPSLSGSKKKLSDLIPLEGNRSYFNSVLESLISLGVLRAQMTMTESEFQGALASSMKKVFVEKPASLEEFFSAVCSGNPEFNTMDKLHDAQDLLQRILEDLDQEVEWEQDGDDPTFVRLLFELKIAPKMHPPMCSHELEMKFFCFPLSIRSKESDEDGFYEVDDAFPASVEDYLKFIFMELRSCAHCNKAPNTGEERSHGMTITKAPLVLVLSLDRLQKDGRKVKGRVHFNETLDIQPFMNLRSEGDSTRYHLVSVIEHSGRADETAVYSSFLRQKGKKKWHSVTNGCLDEVTLDFVLNKVDAYLLFYEREDSGKLLDSISTSVDHQSCISVKMEQEKDVKVPPALDLSDLECKDSNEGRVQCFHLQNVVKGSPNLGNTCFLNVVLQTLLSLDSLRMKMLGADLHTGPLARILRKLFLQTSRLDDSGDTLEVQELHCYICSKYPQFSGMEKQDSAELLSLLLNSLHTEEVENRNLYGSDSRVPTIVEYIFQGEQYTTTTNTVCSHFSDVPDVFLTLSIAIPHPPSEADEATGQDAADSSVENCLLHYTSPSHIYWRCDECSDNQSMVSWQKICVTKAPLILIIQLKRFYQDNHGTIHKRCGHVQFKEEFDVNELVDPRFKEEDGTTYHLVGVIVHIGPPSSYHYIAYVRAGKIEQQQQWSSGSKTWFHTNDLVVTEASLEEVLKSDAYMLFYEKVCPGEQLMDSILTPMESKEPALQQLMVSILTPMESKEPALHNLILKRLSLVDDKLKEIIVLESKVLAGQELNTDQQDQMKHKDALVMVKEELNNILKEEKLLSPHTIKIDKQTLTESQLHSSSSVPFEEEALSEYQKHGSMDSKSQEEAKVEQKFEAFLKRFMLPNVIMAYYRHAFLSLISRCPRSRLLKIEYSHLCQYSKQLAMKVCNEYQRFKVNLENATRKFMQELLPNVSIESVDLRFIGMPSRHMLLNEFLNGPLLKEMKVYGESKVKLPLPDKCLAIQDLLSYIITNHNAGYSWSGRFNIDDMEILGKKIYITKSPTYFEVHNEFSKEIIMVILLDFNKVSELVLKRFHDGGSYVPYINSFIGLFTILHNYTTELAEKAVMDSIQGLIIHHPFLKPPMARSNLLTNIYTACRASDVNDPTNRFRSLLLSSLGQWNSDLGDSQNPVVRKVYCFKGTSQSMDASGQKATTSTRYSDDYYGLIEYMRHLCQHGTDHSADNSGKQQIKLLDEVEIGGAIATADSVSDALTILCIFEAMHGMLDSVWEVYKSCNHSDDAS